MQNLNTKETMARGVIVLNVSEMPQENISVGKGQNYLLVGDNAIWLKKIPDNSIDSIVTDPPAGISFMGRGWDTDKGGRDHWIAWMQEVATECKRVLKPGGHAFVWAIPRTSHWTATAWENAGFEIRDVVAHIFGSGFPKSHNIGLRLDQKLGLQGFRGKETSFSAKVIQQKYVDGRDKVLENGKAVEKYEGKSEIAKQYQGWGTALKPAREDWLLMRKPIESKTVAENVLKYGTGGINIDESRVGTEDMSSQWDREWNDNNGELGKRYSQNNRERNKSVPVGRFPANLIHDNSEEVRACFPESKSGAMNGTYKNTMMKGEPGIRDGKEIYLQQEASSGNASRFFKSIIYQAKASKSERNKGCDLLEEKYKAGKDFRPNHSVKAELGEDGNPFGRWGKIQNNHPTVKPLELMSYLIKMVTPKGGVVLDPFAGSGSTLVAAKQNGYQYIGIEMTEEYIPIIKARLN